MRQDRTLRRDVRGNALWGRRGESRSNALWGSGKRGIITLALAAMLVVPVAGSAASSGNSGPGGGYAVVPASLLAKAAANPLASFDVIVQGDKDSSSARVADEVQKENGNSKRRFMSVHGVQASLTGAQLLKLAKNSHIVAITPNVAVHDSGVQARADFGNRLVASVSMCSLCTDTSADAEGHGTMVAGVAAGSGQYAGGPRNAPLVSIRAANAGG